MDDWGANVYDNAISVAVGKKMGNAFPGMGDCVQF